MTNKILYLLVIFVFSISFNACSTDEKNTQNLGDNDVVESVDDSVDGDVDKYESNESTDFDEELTTDGDNDSIENEVVDELESFESDLDAEESSESSEEETNMCSLPIGSDKCPYCGKVCGDDQDCPPGYTCWMGECTRDCIPDTDNTVINDCGEGFGCHRAAYRIQGTYYLNTYYCARGSAVDCDADVDCRDKDEVCRNYWPNDDLDEIVTMCSPKLPCAAEVGEECSGENLCETDWCLPNIYEEDSNFCSAVCSDDSQCPEGMQCRDLYLFQFIEDFPRIYESFCVPKNFGLPRGENHKLCYRDSQCESLGTECIGLIMGIDQDEYGTFKRVCASRTPNGAKIGETCPEDGVCETQLCVDDKCTRPCRAIDGIGLGLYNDCPDNTICKSHEFVLSDSKKPKLDICQTFDGSLNECMVDSDCPNGEVCGALSAGEDNIYKGHCIAPLGDKLFGEDCRPSGVNASSTCANNLCLSDDKLCTHLCDPNDSSSCPSGWFCSAENPRGDGVIAYVCKQGSAPSDGDEDIESGEESEQEDVESDVVVDSESQEE